MKSAQTAVLALFSLTAFIAFVFPLLKDGVYKQLTLKPDMGAVKRFAFVIIPFACLLGVSQALKLTPDLALRQVLLAAVVPFLICRLGLPARLAGILLLAISVALTTIYPDAAASPNAFAIIAGLTIWKAAENLIVASESTLEDILPALIWLAGSNWIRTVLPASGHESAILLGSLSVALALQVIARPFLTDDKLYIKKIILSATGGLGLLIVMTKLIVLPMVSAICASAALVGAGIFIAYLFDARQEKNETFGVLEAMTVLTLVGILTLVAARMFGNFGLFVLAPAAMVARPGSFAQASGLYFVGRAFVQSFVFSYVKNVTGVNIMHSYTGAALYAGFLIAAVFTLVLRDVADRRWLTTIFLALGALSPLGASYFTHEEPTGSLILSCLSAAVLLVALAPALFRQPVARVENVLLLPVQMTAFALLGNELLSKGNEGTANEKITVIVYCAVIFMVLTSALFWLFSRSGRKPVEVS